MSASGSLEAYKVLWSYHELCWGKVKENPDFTERVSESVSQSVNQSVSQSVSKWVNQSVSELVSESVSESMSESVRVWVSESVSRWECESVSQSDSQSVSLPVRYYISESVSQWNVLHDHKLNKNRITMEVARLVISGYVITMRWKYSHLHCFFSAVRWQKLILSGNFIIHWCTGSLILFKISTHLHDI